MPVRMNNSDEWRKYLAAMFVVIFGCINIIVCCVLMCCLGKVCIKVKEYLCFLLALAEIISIREIDGRKEYYVHFIDCK